MNLKRTAALATALLGALLFYSAGAAGSGLYIGAGAGRGSIKDNSIDFDSNDTAYKAFVGYRFTMIPLLDFAAEGGYIDFGKPSRSSAGQNLQYKLNGWNAAGLVIFPLGPLDFFGKAGALSWSSEKTVAGTTSSKSGSNAFYGAGVGFKIWKLRVRAEYERFDVRDIDRAEMVSVSAVFQF